MLFGDDIILVHETRERTSSIRKIETFEFKGFRNRRTKIWNVAFAKW